MPTTTIDVEAANRRARIAAHRTAGTLALLRQLVLDLGEDATVTAHSAHQLTVALDEVRSALVATCSHGPERVRGVDVFEATTGEMIYIGRCQCGVDALLEIRAAAAPAADDAVITFLSSLPG